MPATWDERKIHRFLAEGKKLAKKRAAALSNNFKRGTLNPELTAQPGTLNKEPVGAATSNLKHQTSNLAVPPTKLDFLKAAIGSLAAEEKAALKKWLAEA